jgi:hypothetical protein
LSRYYAALATLLLSSPSWASDYTFLNSYNFVDGKKIFHLEADYGQVGSAKVTTDPAFGTKTNYGEGNASIYLTHHLNPENSLTWQFGANYLDLGWSGNPLFTKNQYTYGVGSLTWVSNSIQKWRFVINGGVAVDATTFEFGKSGVYYTMLWGRYAQTENIGVNLGFFAYYGAHNGYVLPILGIDWKMTPKWSFNAIFPIDASLNYHFAKHWVTSIVATYLGGPYRFPRKVHGGIGNYDDGVFKVFSTVVEWDLSFVFENLIEIGAGGGWNFGGWIQVSEYNNHNKQYYDFNGAGYARLFATLTF